MSASLLQRHAENLTKIQRQISSSSGEIALKRDGTCCSRSLEYKVGKDLIDISALSNVLEINVQEKYVVVEPLVTMEQLARATLPHNLVVPVITEFRHMTIGGAIQGLGGESTSFKHGFIDESVEEYEAVLADGTIITIDETGPYQDLYHALPGSFGSIAIITKIKLRLKQASKYVRVVYQRVSSINEVNAIFKSAMAEKDGLAFIESVALSKNDFRIARGYMADKISFKDYIFRRCSLKHFWSRWYYSHLVEKSVNDGYHEYYTYEDYLFRWDRGAFWLGIILLDIIGHYKHSFLKRLIFGRMLGCKSLYNVLGKLSLHGREQSFVLQDLIIPGRSTEEFFSFLDELVSIYPLWLIPIKPPAQKKVFSLPHDEDDMYVDIGLWGFQRNPRSIEVNRKIELLLQQLGGRKWLWNQSYFTRDEFWQTYDKVHYNELRDKYQAKGRLINVYDKVTEYYQSIAVAES